MALVSHYSTLSSPFIEEDVACEVYETESEPGELLQIVPLENLAAILRWKCFGFLLSDISSLNRLFSQKYIYVE
jgi:hypothetical protein